MFPKAGSVEEAALSCRRGPFFGQHVHCATFCDYEEVEAYPLTQCWELQNRGAPSNPNAIRKNFTAVARPDASRPQPGPAQALGFGGAHCAIRELLARLCFAKGSRRCRLFTAAKSSYECTNAGLAKSLTSCDKTAEVLKAPPQHERA